MARSTSPFRSKFGLRTVPAVASLAAIVLLAGCDSLLTSQVEEAALRVSNTDPTEAEQGDTLVVRVFGEGFAEGDAPSWDRDGVADTLIVVSSVTFVSENELVASIRIARETDIGLYDVAVTRKRKKGVGSEARAVASDVFEVKEYTPILLGWLPHSLRAGPTTTVTGINDQAVVVGIDGCCMSSHPIAIRWTETDGLARFAGEGWSRVGAINNEGWIVGQRFSGDTAFVAFLFEEEALIDLESLMPPYSANARAINDAGTIVGYAFKDRLLGPTWPVVWRRTSGGAYGSPTELPLPSEEIWVVGDYPRGSTATAINASGDIAGNLVYGASGTMAVVWKAREDGTYDRPVVLGGSADQNTWANDIDDSGRIVGNIDVGTPFTAVLWHPSDYTKFIVLGEQVSGGTARQISNDGMVVGTRYWYGYQTGSWQSTLWHLNAEGETLGVTPLLPAPGYELSVGNGINANGWVVGSSYNSDDFQEATLWRPDQ